MTVVFLARWYPHKYDPMFGLFVQRHAEAAAQFNDITALYVHPDEHARQTYEIERSTINQVDTIRVYYKKTGRISSVWRYFKACQKALQLAGKPDVIHVHVLTRMGVIAWIQHQWHGIPYMITEHWSRYLPGNDYSGSFRKFLTRLVVKNASMVTTVTECLGKAMQSHGLENPNYRILPNVVDFNLFKPIAHHNEIPKIVHISCFEDKSKNIAGLLQALTILKDKGVPYQAVLIGEGMDFDAMKAFAETLGLQNHVRFTGLLQSQELVEELATGDLFVLSSNYETAGVVLVEALACGLPLVATRVGGVPEIVNESNGLLVAPNDTQALAEALETLCRTYTNYDPETLRKQVIGKYSYQQVGKTLNQQYQWIVSLHSR